MAANIFTGAIDNNWGTAGNWSLLAVPTAVDGNTATFDATSPNCTVNTSNRVCNSLSFTGYTNTITMTFGITSSGSITLGAAMVISGTGFLAANATGTLTSAGVAWPNAFILQGTSQTYTLGDNWTLNGLFTCNGTTATTINGAFTITIAAGYTQQTVATVSGAAAFKFTGGTWTSVALTNVLRNNVEIAGNVTFNTNVVWNTGTFTYTSGTVTVTGNTFYCGLSATLNTNGMTFNNVQLGGSSQTYTLLSDIDINGLFTCNGTTTTTINGAFNVKIGGGYTQTTVATVNGSCTFLFDGTGTWTSTVVGNVLRCSVNINLVGTLTFATLVSYNTGTLTYVAGTVDASTNSSTFTIAATGTTLNTAGMSFYNLSITGATTTTLTSNCDVNGVFNVGTTTSTTTINGAFTMTVAGGLGMGNVTTGTVTGTFLLKLDGTQTVTPPSSTGRLTANWEIAAGAGTVTFGAGSFRTISNTFTYTSGTIISTGATLLPSTCTLTLNALFQFETVGLSASCTFNGTNGFTFGTLSLAQAGATHTFAAGKTYTVATAFTSTAATLASPSAFQSSSGGSQFLFNLVQGASQDIGFLNATDVDSRGGQTIWDFKGTFSNTLNWNPLTASAMQQSSTWAG